MMQGFGLKLSDIRTILSSVPAILTLEREYSLPERLLSVKQLFSLSTVWYVYGIVWIDMGWCCRILTGTATALLLCPLVCNSSLIYTLISILCVCT
ncbi:hypothetical protein EON64_08940 [archaeon]|nr:MAG: hypothetical protein EON64_08940 [archaeon]